MPGATVLPKLSVVECAHWIQASELVVGADTGLVHLAHALQRRTVMLFAATSREHFGVNDPGRSVSIGEEGAPPDVPQVLAAIESVTNSPQKPVPHSAESGATVR